MSLSSLSPRFVPIAAGLLLPLAALAAPMGAGCMQAASAAQAPCPPAARASSPMPGGMLTRQAHEEHMRRMASFKSYEECRAYMDDWQARMQHGDRPASRPMDDACAGLPRLKP